MPISITVETNDIEDKALRWAERDPQKWLDTLVHHRAQCAMKELYSVELQKAMMNSDVDTISSNIEEVVLTSTELTAEEKNKLVENQLISLPENADLAEQIGKITTPSVVADSPRTFLGGSI